MSKETTYKVQMIDSDTPAAWMRRPDVTSVVADPQDSGRVNYTVRTTDEDALEDALEEDPDVIRYQKADFSAIPQITQSEARELYTAANNAGRGYPLGGDDDTVSDVAASLAEHERAPVLCGRTPDDVYVVRGDDDHVLIGGDAKARSPWAVDVTVDELITLRWDHRPR